MRDEIAKNFIKIVILLTVAVILLFAWAPWLTEEYGKEKVLNYFSQKYNFDKNNILITSIDKRPFAIHLGIVYVPSNKSLPESSVHAWITFYGEVKHDQFMRTLKLGS